jgi:uncharacterized lipoprotein YddW (UPF0748 family)
MRAGMCVAASVVAGCTATPTRDTGRDEAELRGTWITTTANNALATPVDTAQTMRRLKEIGLNTVYVEAWKNGYAQFPSEVLRRTIGVDRRPARMAMDPADAPDQAAPPGRDVFEEALIEAHRNGLIVVAWFEYGFMAAHRSTMNHLRAQKPEWLSRDIKGGEVAPNGFVWMNPLHPEAQRFLTDLVLEAIDRYDLDGVQLDDRIVWPHVTMGYDDYTRTVYAREHAGREPPQDARDPAWMRWRADKINAFAQQFVSEIRARRPGLVVSLSPAVYPWSWEHYLLEWPQWVAWKRPRWDEFIPQAYRTSYESFEKTWREQAAHVKAAGHDRQRDLMAGIRIQGDGKDSSWPQLRDSILLARSMGNGGHVLWFSKGVLDLYANELRAFYATPASNPHFHPHWRPGSIPLVRSAMEVGGSQTVWLRRDLPRGRYRLIAHDGVKWAFMSDPVEGDAVSSGQTHLVLPANIRRAELLPDRREALSRGQRSP